MARRNSVFLYGPTRSGKTTLLRRIRDYLSLQKESIVVRVSAEDLSTELVKSIRKGGTVAGFYDKFDHCDALLVDDLWILRGKPNTTQEIFLLLNRLVDRGKLVMTAWDIPPATLSRGAKSVRDLRRRSTFLKMEACRTSDRQSVRHLRKRLLRERFAPDQQKLFTLVNNVPLFELA